MKRQTLQSGAGLLAAALLGAGLGGAGLGALAGAGALCVRPLLRGARAPRRLRCAAAAAVLYGAEVLAVFVLSGGARLASDAHAMLWLAVAALCGAADVNSV